MLERLDPRRTLLLVVDVQERLAAVMPKERFARLVANAEVLLEAASVLSMPVLATEQYPKGLGPTVPRLRDRLASLRVTPIEKLSFDALGEPSAARALAAHDPAAVVVVGMESHVCVFQTVRELRRRRMRTVVALDAVTSRTEENRLAGLALAERCGAVTMPTESIVFDLLERAGTEAFKTLSKLIK
jgi:nicotinamidase-related amidase